MKLHANAKLTPAGRLRLCRRIQEEGRSVTGRRFERVAEVYFFTIREGRIAAAWGLEDTASRRRQLGLPGD